MAAVLSKAVEQYRKVMLALAAIHLVVLLLVIFTPGGIIWFFNAVSRVVAPHAVAPNISQIPADHYFYDTYNKEIAKPEGLTTLPNHAFYQAMAASYLAIVVLIAGLNFFDPERNAPLAPLLLVGKAVGGLYGLGFYLWSHHYLVNLLLPIVDWPVVLLVLVVWMRAKTALTAPAGAPPAA
jgi:hypothetical protein